MARFLLKKHTGEKNLQSDLKTEEQSFVPGNTYSGFTHEVVSEKIFFQEMLSEIISIEKAYLQNQYPEINVTIREEFAFFSKKKSVQILLTNLVSNAVRYQGSDTPLAYVYIKIHTHSTGTNILIRNNNAGAKKDAPKTGDRQYATRVKSHQFGLELYIVKETIKKLEGQLEIEFELEEGTEYKVHLPNLLQ